MPILPAERDPRLITVRRGGTLTDVDHRLLAEWAALCAEHVLPLFEHAEPNDSRPRDAIDIGRAWVRGEVRMRDAHRAAFPANSAGRDLREPAKYAALAAGQAVAVAHVAAHALGAAAMRSGQPLRAPLRAVSLRRRASPSETGSENGSPRRFGISSSMTSGVEVRSAGMPSTTDADTAHAVIASVSLRSSHGRFRMGYVLGTTLKESLGPWRISPPTSSRNG